jgi:hypothetical protein
LRVCLPGYFPQLRTVIEEPPASVLILALVSILGRFHEVAVLRIHCLQLNEQPGLVRKGLVMEEGGEIHKGLGGDLPNDRLVMSVMEQVAVTVSADVVSITEEVGGFFHSDADGSWQVERPCTQRIRRACHPLDHLLAAMMRQVDGGALEYLEQLSALFGSGPFTRAALLLKRRRCLPPLAIKRRLLLTSVLHRTRDQRGAPPEQGTHDGRHQIRGPGGGFSDQRLRHQTKSVHQVPPRCRPGRGVYMVPQR